MTSSHSTADIAALDQLTGGAFSAAHSSERSALLRAWLEGQPALEQLQEVYREMSARDKGAAKVIKERLDEQKRLREQDQLVALWADKAEQLLGAARLNIADALAWQRDAAKAGAPLSREPLAQLKNRLAEVVRRVEDLQHQVMVQREAAVLLAQRIEVFSTKALAEAQASREALQSDVQAWTRQAEQLPTDTAWPSVDLKYPGQLETSRNQLQAVWAGFDAALQQALSALADPGAALPSVPVWADELRAARGQAPAQAAAAVADAAALAGEAKAPKVAKTRLDAAERQALREQATAAVLQELQALEQEVAQGHGKASAGAASALRQVLKTHGRHLDPALDARVHEALTAAGEMEGWQRWRADQLRQDLLTRAQALLGPDKAPTLGGRKMQEALRQLREAWKQTDQGGLPNHALWKKFDAACTEAYATVQAWLDQLKQETAAQKSLRVQLIDEVKAWTAAQAGNTDWRAQARTVHQFSERWRNAGHLSEKAYAELQPQWKAAIHAAALPLEAAQKASHQRRQALIEEARALGAAPSLRIDAVKALQQRWQQEAQAVPLDRKTEQKLWETFRQPIDEAFQRKGTARTAHDAPLSARDKAVLDASKALDEANASGDVARIRSAMAALDAALKAQADQPAAAKAEAAKTEEPQPAPSESPAAEPASSDAAAGEASADPSSVTEVAQAGEAGEPSETAEAALTAPVTPVAPVTAPKPARPVVAVRGDDRPGQKKTEAQAAKSGRREGRPGERRDDRGPREGRREFGREGAGREGGRDAWRDEPRAPRLADAAFRAQRDARERAELALRKLAAQAHGETLVRVLSAWESRQAEALPSAQELGKAVSASARQAWAQALGQATASQAGPSLLRLEMAAEVPTPAEHLSERRALQLQLLTQRREAGPAQTWAHDVAQVLASAHDAASARRLQNALKQLLRR